MLTNLTYSQHLFVATFIIPIPNITATTLGNPIFIKNIRIRKTGIKTAKNKAILFAIVSFFLTLGGVGGNFFIIGISG